MLRTALTFILFSATAIVLTACPSKPTYPACEKDKDCKKAEFCVKKQCQKCRTDDDCDDGFRCNGGRCDPIANYCASNADCDNGAACKDNRCAPCEKDGECGAGGRCRNGQCLKAGQCTTDDDCPENSECQNGVCVAPPDDTADANAPKCTPEPVYFDFNESVLSAEATSKLQKAADCIKSVPNRRIRVEGHTDPRGTEEYNLSLGDRRARSALRYLTRLGVEGRRMRPVAKGKLEATGSNSSGWAFDRKVTFVWE